jgi:hypothetical protein
VAQLSTLGSKREFMDDISPKKSERGALVGLALVSLIFLPFLSEVFTFKFLDGPGMGDIWTPIYYGITALCSLGAAFGVARLFSLAGAARLVSVIILAPILYYVSFHVTRIVVLLLFLPRH